MSQKQFKVMGPDRLVDQSRKTGKGEEEKKKIQAILIASQIHLATILPVTDQFHNGKYE